MKTKQRVKNKAVKIKCDKEKRREMLLLGRYAPPVFSLLTEQDEDLGCPIYICHYCYWSKSK